jgi:hypothetical protein
MEENKLPTPAIIKSTLSLEASRVNYQKVLQHISNVTITRDNVNENHTKEIKDIIKALEKKKEEINRPLLDAQKATVKALKEICDPLQEQIDRIAGETKTIALAIKSENDKQILEQNRVNIAKSAIVSFVNQVAVDIANAKTDADIVLIEKRIGSEGTKTSVYAEFISELTLACEDLRPMIKKQKENIRTLQDIEVREKLALERGDIVTATSLMGQKEYMGQLIEETGMRIHEKAFEQASVIDIVVPEIMFQLEMGGIGHKNIE